MSTLVGRKLLIEAQPGALGRRLAQVAAARGAQVVFRQENAPGQLGLERGGFDGWSLSLPADLSCEAGVEHFFDQALEHLPALDAVIHILAPFYLRQRAGKLATTSLTEWHQVVTQRLHIPFLLARRTLLEFLANGGGHLLWISLIFNPDENGLEATTLFALRALARSLTKEYGRRGVICNQIVYRLPNEPTANGGADALSGDPALLDLALFLVSAEASFINGEVLHLSV